MSVLEEKMNREVLRYAVSRAISYPCCGRIADVRDAVLVMAESDKGRGTQLYCAPCVEEGGGVESAKQRLVDLGFSVEVYEGKELFKR